MNTASILIKTDPNVKKKAQETAQMLGFSLSSIVNAFLRQFVKSKTISFSAMELDETPNEYFKQAIKKAREAREQGKASPVFDTAEEMISWLNKQGYENSTQP